jgi:multidrug efflux pump subunit AcrA (membrane-fusion protein)
MDKNKLIFPGPARTGKIFAILLVIFILTGCAAGNSGNDNSGGATGVVSTVTITDTIETSGNLSADKLAALAWGTSGVVEKVNVKVGDKVKINDILASLRLDSVASDIVAGQSDLATAQRDLQDLLDSNTSFAQAQLDVISARGDLEAAQNTWDGLAYPRATDALIKNTQAKIWDAEKRLTIASKQYREQQHNPDGDPEKTAALLELTNAQLALNDLNALYNWYTGKPTQADYEEAKAKLDVARAALEDAKRKRDNVKEGADPLKIAAAQGKVAAAQATVNTMYIIAPFDGEVLSVQAGVGNSVVKDDSAVELVDRQTLKVETLVDETQISSVKIDNPAKITFDALPDIVLTGKVTGISRIGVTANGLVKYTVVVSVDPTDKNVLFGATANVAITTGAPHPALAVPVLAVMSDSRGEYVLVISADGSRTRRVSVQSGDLSGNLVTITTTENLKAGDQVELGTGSSSNSNPNSGGGGGFQFRGPGG